jgi:hypothetical protein
MALTRALCSVLLLMSSAVQAGHQPMSSFPAMDANGDGRVSEAEHHAAVRRMFKTMDRNGDGRVTAAEMQAARPTVSGKAKSVGLGPSEAEKIKAIDSNGDGVLSAEEHEAGARTMFAAMDGNADRALSRREFDDGHAKPKGAARKPSGRPP